VIGRVLTVPERRGQGLGRVLMKEALARIQKEFGSVSIEMSAQTHLEKFYNEFGFTRVGESYLEDGIPHLKMKKHQTEQLSS
jgi:ElaA protein